MACFIVPLGEVIVTTVIQKVVENNEKKAGDGKTNNAGGKWSQRLGWLNAMLWGGCILLALDHVWLGEVVPWPPFLTAMQNPADIAPMLYEVATLGTTMAVVLTVVWAIIVIVAEAKSKVAMPEVEVKPVSGGA